MNDVIRFPCPGCGKPLRAPAANAGRRARCTCGLTIRVPGGVPAPAAAPLDLDAPPPRPPVRSKRLPVPDDEDAPAGRPVWPWLAGGAAALGLAAVVLVTVVVLVVGKSRRPTDTPEQAVATGLPGKPAAATGKPARPADAAFQAVLALEKKAGDDYEAALAAYTKFLAENAPVPPEYQRQARQKIDTELPGKIDDRDYQRAADAAAAAKADDAARKHWSQYLSQHPAGRHAAQVKQRLDALTTWKAELVEAKTAGQFEIQKDVLYEPTGEGRRLVLLAVKFEARSATPGTLDDRVRPGANFLSVEALDFLKGEGKIAKIFNFSGDRERLAKPARLFMANQVGFILGDGLRLHPVWTTEPAPCAYGATLATNTTLHIGTPAEDTAVLRYVRGRDNTAALVQPGKPVTLTLVYDVPADQRKGELLFYDCPPVPVTVPR